MLSPLATGTLSVEATSHDDLGLREYLVVHGEARVEEGGTAALFQRFAHVHLGPDVTFPPRAGRAATCFGSPRSGWAAAGPGPVIGGKADRTLGSTAMAASAEAVSVSV
jgi:hypothetical protein